MFHAGIDFAHDGRPRSISSLRSSQSGSRGARRGALAESAAPTVGVCRYVEKLALVVSEPRIGQGSVNHGLDVFRRVMSQERCGGTGVASRDDRARGRQLRFGESLGGNGRGRDRVPPARDLCSLARPHFFYSVGGLLVWFLLCLLRVSWDAPPRHRVANPARRDTTVRLARPREPRQELIVHAVAVRLVALRRAFHESDAAQGVKRCARSGLPDSRVSRDSFDRRPCLARRIGARTQRTARRLRGTADGQGDPGHEPPTIAQATS